MPLRVSRFVLLATVFALVAGTGIVHGLLTDRWASRPAEQAVALDDVPMTIEDWDGAPAELDQDQLPVVDGGKAILRRYVNRVNGTVVTLFLTTGPAGTIIASHTPESCYPGAGFHFAGPALKRSIPTGPDARPQEFRVLTFSKTERASPVHVRVFWGWSVAGDWQNPDYPRLTFAGKRRLHKVYVIRQLARPGEPVDHDPALPFIQALVPQLRKTLFAGAGG